MSKHTLQIATLGPDTDPVLVGIRTLPVHKLYLVHLESDKQIAQKLRSDLASVLKVDVETQSIPNNDILTHVLEGVAGILSKEKENFDDVIFNVTSGEKLLGCAALSAAFVNGLKAVAIMNGEPMMLPVLKFSYDRLVSQTKLDILKALQKKGGAVESLEELKELTGYGKPMLSYHIQGAEDSQGLVDLGLVEVKRGDRGRSMIQETTLGRLLTLGR
jgi:DNA-binding transcriptional ArsR family regulator